MSRLYYPDCTTMKHYTICSMCAMLPSVCNGGSLGKVLANANKLTDSVHWHMLSTVEQAFHALLKCSLVWSSESGLQTSLETSACALIISFLMCSNDFIFDMSQICLTSATNEATDHP